MRVDDDSDIWRPLRDPRWWSCLGLLLLNDHVLKHQASAVDWLGATTGKLSDVCGLVVAPVLCAVIAKRFSSSKWVVGASFMLPVLVFVALNSSLAFAEQWMALSRTVGVPQNVWSDWTDLLALPAAWMAWRVVKTPRPVTPSRFDSLAVAAGACACLATSSGWEGPSPDPSLRNRAWWFADLRGNVHTLFRHPHHMRDTASGTSIRETDSLTRLSLLFSGGLNWKL